MWDNNDRQDWHLAVTQGSGGVSRGVPATGRGGSMVALAALTATTDNNSVGSAAAAATSPAQSFTSRAANASGPAATVLKMLDSLRVCAIGDGCGFISASGLERAEQQVLHGANAPAQDAAAAAEAAGQLVFTMPQQPVAGLPVSLYINKAALQDLIKRAPNMCLQVGFNDWSIGVQKVGAMMNLGMCLVIWVLVWVKGSGTIMSLGVQGAQQQVGIRGIKVPQGLMGFCCSLDS